jgi:hypothetical protein
MQGDKSRILIPTTKGLVEVLLLTEEDPSIGRSVACIGGTTETADIDAAYNAFVSRTTGVVERHFGHACYRLDVSGRIDAGSSWQLGVLAAHSLYAAGRLAQENDAAGSVIWATGSVRAVDLTVGAVSHLDEKLAQSLDRLKKEAQADRQVLVVVPAANAENVSSAIRTELAEHGIRVLEIAAVPSLWDSLSVAPQDEASDTSGMLSPLQSVTRKSDGSRWSKRNVAALLVLTVLIGAVTALASRYWPTVETMDGERRLQTQLSAALARSIPKAASSYREQVAEAFVKLNMHRAMAVASQAQKTYRTGEWPSRELAQEKLLEKCQQHYDEPCALVATNDDVIAPGSDGSLPLRDAPKVRYSGIFNPERVPGIRQRDEQRIDVAGYLTAANPKASAFHAAGLLHVISGAPSQRAAEENALRACNADPARTTSGGGPCYLYSIENRVVLPLRATGPITSAPPVVAATQAPLSKPVLPATQATKPPSPANQPLVSSPLLASPQSSDAKASAAPAALRDVLLRALEKMAPVYALREVQVREYLAAKSHKALAVYPPSASWRTYGWASEKLAEERVLEACQVRFGGPCVLLAVNDTVHGNAGDPTWPRRAMPRVAYDGTFAPDQIPASTQTLKQRADVTGYHAAPTFKAAAFHPYGRLFVVTGAAAQRVAEERALEACNRDPDRGGKDGECLLYAVDDQVVLSRRLTSPLTPP